MACQLYSFKRDQHSALGSYIAADRQSDMPQLIDTFYRWQDFEAATGMGASPYMYPNAQPWDGQYDPFDASGRNTANLLKSSPKTPVANIMKFGRVSAAGGMGHCQPPRG